MARSPFRRFLRRICLILALPVLTTSVWLMAAGPTVACSCIGPQPMAAYDTPDNAVFSGIAGPLDARGVPVEVTTWYHGTGAAPLVYLAATSFSDGSSCGIGTPAVGSGWIWVTYLPEEPGDPTAGLCSPSAMLGTPEGNAMVADATTTFGGAPPPGAGDPPDETPSPPIAADLAPAILVGTIAIGVMIVAGAALLARWRPRSV